MGTRQSSWEAAAAGFKNQFTVARARRCSFFKYIFTLLKTISPLTTHRARCASPSMTRLRRFGPARLIDRLQEREYCPLAGILAASLAVSELFLSFADISVEAGRRAVALSLWRPEVAVSDPSTVGVPVEFLPRALLILGLGALGHRLSLDPRRSALCRHPRGYVLPQRL
jgi:hypothetical protein